MSKHDEGQSPVSEAESEESQKRERHVEEPALVRGL